MSRKTLLNDTHDQYLKDFYNGKHKDLIKIAKDLGVDRNVVKRKLIKLGLFIPNLKTTYSLNDNLFKTWSFDLAYFLGFIAADGYLIKNRNIIRIAIHRKDITILEKFKILFNSDAPINLYQTKTTPVARLDLYSKILMKDIIDMGFVQNKASRLVIPKNMPIKYIYSFIRGFFDGDGCVGLKTNSKCSIKCSMVSLSKSFLEDIRSHCFDLGQIRIKALPGQYLHKQTLYQWDMANKDSIKFRDLIYRDGNLYLDRKHDIFFKDYKLTYKVEWRPSEVKFLLDNIDSLELEDIASTLNRPIRGVKEKLRTIG